MGDLDPGKMNVGSRSRKSRWDGDNTRCGLSLLCIRENLSSPSCSQALMVFRCFLEGEGHFESLVPVRISRLYKLQSSCPLPIRLRSLLA